MTYSASTILGKRLAERLGPWLDEPGDLERLADSMGQMFQAILELAEEEGEDGTAGYVPAWGRLLDPATCPAKDLPYLGQFVGVEVPTGATEAEARALVLAEAGLERGTLKSVEKAVIRAIGYQFPTLAVADSFTRANEDPLSNGGKWSTISLTSGTGEVSENAWSPVLVFPTPYGARWNASEQATPAVSVEVVELPGVKERYFGVWCALSSAEPSGYFMRWKEQKVEVFTVTLERWSAGTSTTLATTTSTLEEGDSIAVSLSEGSLRAWRKHGAAWMLLVEAQDKTFTTGYTGIEAAGNAVQMANFAFGTTGSAGPATFLIQERTNAQGQTAGYAFNVIVGSGGATTALKEAIESVKPGGLTFSIIESTNAWINGTRKWSAVTAAKKWSAIKTGEY